MFKFFRQHNKWLLVVIGSLAMVGFLITGAVQDWFKSSPTETLIGLLADGRALHASDRMAAKAELDILGPVVRDPALLAGSDNTEAAPQRWMLIQAEADMDGLGASNSEITSALFLTGFGAKDANGKSTGTLDEQAIQAYCAHIGTNEAGLRLALGHYLRAETLRQLTSGVGHDLFTGAGGAATPGLQRLGILPALLQQSRAHQQQAYMSMMGGQNDEESQLQAMRQMMLARRTTELQHGSQRLSGPQLAHALESLHAEVSGQLVVIPANTPTRLAQTAEPTTDELQALFAPLKDAPRGTPPYGFGYRLPPRVMIEALGVPLSQTHRLTDAAVTEDQVRAWFDDHPENFADPKKKDGGKPVRLTPANREKARAQLRDELAKNKALEIARFAELALAGDWRAASANNNQLPKDFTPTTLAAVAEAVKKKFNITPTLLTPAQIESEAVAAWTKLRKQPPLHTAGAEAGWMTAQELAAHPLFGSATLISQASVSLPMAANHLAGGPEERPLPSSLTLAVNLPLPAARDHQDTCWITRVVAADPARAAADLAEVKPQVVRDARELAAYRTLTTHADALAGNAAATGDLAKFTSDSDRLHAVPSLTRVDFAAQGASPLIPGVGTSEALVKAVFGRAEQLHAKQGGLLAAAPLAKRLLAVPVDNLRAVVLFEIQRYNLIPESECRALAANPWSRFAVHTATLADLKDPQDPLTLENLQKRLGWTAAK